MVFRFASFRILAISGVIVSLLGAARATRAQTDEAKPVPILTGGAAVLSNVQNGQPQLMTTASPVLLVPVSDNILIESRGKLQDSFQSSDAAGWHQATTTEGLDYAQVDYIANRYVTFTAGRFLTPFGTFNERLLPFWIRCLQNSPLIFPIATGSSNGAMLRGGLATARANFNYAAYFSTLSTNSILKSYRTAGGRFGVFIPSRRLEVGMSFQQLLQQDRSRSYGGHFGWQPGSIPLNLRGEYARSVVKGSGFWLEGDYRLSQFSRIRKFELVGRAQQFLTGRLSAADASNAGLPATGTVEMDFGLNYYFRDGMKATSSYGRQFVSAAQDSNIWTAGLSYRFVVPLGAKEIR